MDFTAFLIEEFMQSSSSSDEDEEFILKLINRNPQPGLEGFVENVVHLYSDADFKTKLRISRESFFYLIERYSQSYLKRRYQGGRLQTSVETQILSFLWFSGNKITFREVANLFDLSISNVHRSFNCVLNFLVNDLAPELIKLPKLNEEKESIANEFQKICGIPNILGCIDRSYITIRRPKNKMNSKYQKHDGISMTIQGICDSNLKFIDVVAGIYNKMTDAQVLKNSLIGKELPSLCSTSYYLLGDAAYPLREYLLTPYKDCENLTDAEKNYNTCFFKAQIKIEDAFCLLKNRFRQLMRIEFHNAETMAKFVIACCVLHNICIDRKEILEEEITNTESNNNNDEPIESERRDLLLTQLGQLKRDEIKNLAKMLKVQ